MPTKIDIVLWDSCIFLDYFKKSPDRYDFIKAIVIKQKKESW